MFALSIFLTSGDAPGFAGGAVGEPVGDATGDATGLAVATGAGVVGGLFGIGSFVHAPKTATDAVKIVDNIIDLLIVFLLVLDHFERNGTTDGPSAGCENAAGLIPNVFPRTTSLEIRLPLKINTAPVRTRQAEKLARETKIIYRAVGFLLKMSAPLGAKCL